MPFCPEVVYNIFSIFADATSAAAFTNIAKLLLVGIIYRSNAPQKTREKPTIAKKEENKKADAINAIMPSKIIDRMVTLVEVCSDINISLTLNIKIICSSLLIYDYLL